MLKSNPYLDDQSSFYHNLRTLNSGILSYLEWRDNVGMLGKEDLEKGELHGVAKNDSKTSKDLAGEVYPESDMANGLVGWEGQDDIENPR